MREKPIMNTNRIIAVKTNTSAPTKRDVARAKERYLLVDLTEGKRVQSVIYCDSGHIFITADSVGCFTKYFPNQKRIFPREGGQKCGK